MDGIYEVIGQRQLTQLDFRGLAYVAWEVSYRTRSGAVGSVILPADRYTIENVRAAIESEVENVETIAQLGRSEG